jgi:hypothetical protein
MELAIELAPAAKKDYYEEQIKRYKSEKADIKLNAEKLEAQATQFDEMSEAELHQHHRWAQATTVLQVAIALAAIALLTRKTWVEYAMFGTGALGVGVGILAALHI